jgi:predicted nucleotidyltransferase
MSNTALLTSPTLDDLRAHRDEILALARRHGAYNVRVFGSVARGDAAPTSDIDLLVSFSNHTSIYDISGLWQDLQELLGCSVDLITDDEHPRHEHFMRRILKDAVAL